MFRHSDFEIRRIRGILKNILALREEIMSLSDAELIAKTDYFRRQIKEGKSLDDILVPAFAVIREADRRVLGMEPFPVQILGGILLHQGRVAQMRTGEGKTLVATLPAYLNALSGNGVHVVTVNEYLAKRDADQMGQVHRFLGLSVSFVSSSMSREEKKDAYACDISYVTNSELGFDYLRDNMACKTKDIVLRGLEYAIIDEVDSILIDEARTPLIISGAEMESMALYQKADTFAKILVKGEASGDFSKIDSLAGDHIQEEGDFIVDEKGKTVTLTQEGIAKAERFFSLSCFAEEENLVLQHAIFTALKANYTMHKDQDYIVKDGKIYIVDSFTGRVMDGRRFSDGLHQALEAKELLSIAPESRTVASITYQSFFNKYQKKAGMTGTGEEEEKEFREVYSMDVVRVPTNRPIARIDKKDRIFATKKEKYQAILWDVYRTNQKGQPVLVGTADIESSEELSLLFSKMGIPHEVLNAKNDEEEAKIVEKAGEAFAVTIATNMAGRGTDIKLTKEARSLGGLKVIGCERHESRRIDEQLRGRSGRQGDVGESIFYVSLEDKLMRLHSDLPKKETKRINSSSCRKAVDRAQKKVELNHYGVRKQVLEYDLINNAQREMIYEERKKVLQGQNMKQTVIHMIEDLIEDLIEKDRDFSLLQDDVAKVFGITLSQKSWKGDMRKKLLKGRLVELYASQEKDSETGEDMRVLERQVLLRTIDNQWMRHIENMERLRQWVGLKSYAQKDPKAEYKRMSYLAFEEMTKKIRYDTIRSLYVAKSLMQ